MLGGILKDARERQSLTIQDLENETSIRRAYISALEEENWKALPAPVYVRGFIRNLARFLNIESDALIAEYNSILNGKTAEEKTDAKTVQPYNDIPEAKREPIYETKREVKQNDIPRDKLGLPIRDRRINKKKRSGAFLTLFLILALVGAGAFYFISRDSNAHSAVNTEEKKVEDAKDKSVTEAAKPKPTKVTEALPAQNAEPKAAETAPATPTESQSQPQAQSPANPADGVEIVAKFSGDCWTKVVIDGNTVFEDMANSGNSYTWKGKNDITVLAGNAGAIEVTHNGKNIGALGSYGQVTEKVFKK